MPRSGPRPRPRPPGFSPAHDVAGDDADPSVGGAGGRGEVGGGPGRLVGAPSVQIAKATGARVLAVTRSADKRGFLQRIGADEVIVAREGENFSQEVRRLMGGEGVDVVVDNVGSRVFDACFDSLAVHGRYAMVGQLFGEEISINPARIFFKRAKILGVGSVSRAQLEDVIALAVRGIVRPEINQILPLAEFARAHEIVEKGAAAGRVVLKP